MKEEDGVLGRIVLEQLRHEVKIMVRKVRYDPEWREMIQKFSEVERTAFERAFEEGMWDALVEDESTSRFYKILNTKLAKSDEAQTKNFVKATELIVEKIDKLATMKAIRSAEDSDSDDDFFGDKFPFEETLLKNLNKKLAHAKDWKNLNLNDYWLIGESLETFLNCTRLAY